MTRIVKPAARNGFQVIDVEAKVLFHCHKILNTIIVNVILEMVVGEQTLSANYEWIDGKVILTVRRAMQ